MKGLAGLPCFALFLSGIVLSWPVYLVDIKIHSTDSDWECCIQFSFCSKDPVGTDLVCLALTVSVWHWPCLFGITNKPSGKRSCWHWPCLFGITNKPSGKRSCWHWPCLFGTDLVCLASQTNHQAKEMEKMKTVVIACRTSVKAAKVDGRIWGLKKSNGIAPYGMNKVLLIELKDFQAWKSLWRGWGTMTTTKTSADFSIILWNGCSICCCRDWGWRFCFCYILCQYDFQSIAAPLFFYLFVFPWEK